MGNADVDSEIEEFLRFNSKKFDPYFLKIEMGGRKIGVTHRPSDNRKYFATSLRGDSSKAGLNVIFNGHLHSKYGGEFQGIKVVRPGALINGINFAIFETETNEAEFVNDEN